jgi:hypothetical protein
MGLLYGIHVSRTLKLKLFNVACSVYCIVTIWGRRPAFVDFPPFLLITDGSLDVNAPNLSLGLSERAAS